MGFLWYPSGGVEAGIDGRLEIRNQDAEVTNCIVSVQSKATEGTFEGETETELTFTCSERDLRYWLKGNLPVILVYYASANGRGLLAIAKRLLFRSDPKSDKKATFHKISRLLQSLSEGRTPEAGTPE